MLILQSELKIFLCYMKSMMLHKEPEFFSECIIGIWEEEKLNFNPDDDDE
jgi:hypothetical protein